jgi:hypothetical protein
MAKPLRDVAPKAPKKGEFTGVNKSKTEPADISDFVPDSASGNRDFAKKHKIEKHEYPHGDEAFTSGKVKGAPYKKQDQKVYEATMKCESCGKMYEGESCGCGSKVPQAGDGKRGMIADKKKLEEVLTKKTPAGEVISDFVHSKNKTFSGDSKKQRIKRALGAYYGMHPEKSKKMEEETEQIDELKAETVGNYLKGAAPSLRHLGTDAAYANMTNDDARANKLRDKARNRQASVYTAVNKLTGGARVPANEEVEYVTEGGMPASVIKSKQNRANMTDKEFADVHQNKSDDDLRSMAWRHGYGKPGTPGHEHYVNRRAKGLKEDLAMPMLEGDKKKKTQKESAPGDTPMRFPSGNVGDSDTGRV